MKNALSFFCFKQVLLILFLLHLHLLFAEVNYSNECILKEKEQNYSLKQGFSVNNFNPLTQESLNAMFSFLQEGEYKQEELSFPVFSSLNWGIKAKSEKLIITGGNTSVFGIISRMKNPKYLMYSPFKSYIALSTGLNSSLVSINSGEKEIQYNIGVFFPELNLTDLSFIKPSIFLVFVPEFNESLSQFIEILSLPLFIDKKQKLDFSLAVSQFGLYPDKETTWFLQEKYFKESMHQSLACEIRYQNPYINFFTSYGCSGQPFGDIKQYTRNQFSLKTGFLKSSSFLLNLDLSLIDIDYITLSNTLIRETFHASVNPQFSFYIGYPFYGSLDTGFVIDMSLKHSKGLNYQTDFCKNGSTGIKFYNSNIVLYFMARIKNYELNDEAYQLNGSVFYIFDLGQTKASGKINFTETKETSVDNSKEIKLRITLADKVNKNFDVSAYAELLWVGIEKDLNKIVFNCDVRYKNLSTFILCDCNIADDKTFENIKLKASINYKIVF